jgi:hypothetical protein
MPKGQRNEQIASFIQTEDDQRRDDDSGGAIHNR